MPFIIVLIVIVALVIARNIRIVPQAHCMVIERLGQYACTWDAGIHVKVPFIDRVVKNISLKEQVLDFPPQSVITKDNVTVSIDSVVYAYVFNAKEYVYGVENPILGLQNLAATTLRSVIGAMELDATLSSREEINSKMQHILDEATDKWGIKVTRVEIKNITPPDEIEQVMTKQMRAERERRQTVLEAQAHQESVVSRAEGDKKAKILAAEAERDAQIALAKGRAEAIRLVYDAEAEGISKLAGSGISEGVLKLRAIEAMKDISDGQATKIYLPNDLAAPLASLHLAGDALGLAKQVPGSGTPRMQMRKQEVRENAKQQVEADPCVTPESSGSTVSSAKANALMQQRLQAPNRTLR